MFIKFTTLIIPTKNRLNSLNRLIYSIGSKSISKKEYEFFKQTSPLGFILFSRNYSNKKQITNLINELKNSDSIKSEVFLQPMMPATRAIDNTSPFLALPSVIILKVSRFILTVPFAMANRSVLSFELTSTM